MTRPMRMIVSILGGFGCVLALCGLIVLCHKYPAVLAITVLLVVAGIIAAVIYDRLTEEDW